MSYMRGRGPNNTHSAKPCENHIDDVVHRLYHQQDFAGKTMARTHDLTSMRNSVGGSEERSVEPSSALADKLRQSFGHVRFSDGAFDILQHPKCPRRMSDSYDTQLQNSPVGIGLSYKLKTQYTL